MSRFVASRCNCGGYFSGNHKDGCASFVAADSTSASQLGVSLNNPIGGQMRQKIEGLHEVDGNGNPTGGTTRGTGIEIRWQDGPLGRDGDRQEPNGAFVEGVIAAAIDRINFYNTASDGRFRCRQNSLAITKLEEALHWLDDRTREREERAVEGTHAP